MPLLLIVMALITLAARTQQGNAYQDVHGRYRLSVPTGWQTQVNGDTPSFTNGAGTIQVLLSTAASPAAAVDEAANAYRQGFTTFNILNRGNTTLGNHAAHGLNVDGTSTAGKRLSVLMLAQSAGGNRYFVLISAVPLEQASLNNGVMEMAKSVRFKGE